MMTDQLSSSDCPSSLRLPDCETALSTYVRKLILECTFSDQRDCKVLNEDGLIDFSYICSKLAGMFYNKGIKRGFPCINVCQVLREMLKTEAKGGGFQQLPRDLANNDWNALEKNV